MMPKMQIISTGRYLPPRIVTNEDLSQWMDTSDEWIQQRTGIVQRHWVPTEGGVGSSDLGVEAAKIALNRAGWHVDAVDFVIFATMTPDIFLPGSGCLMQHKLGMGDTPTLDIRQQCTGFLYGLSVADAFVRTKAYSRILLVGAEVHSTGLDISTKGRDVSVIFGDGAAAVCIEGLETDDEVGLLSSVLHADGKLSGSLMVEGPASRENPRIDHAMLDQGRQMPYMDGRTIFKEAVRRLPQAAGKALKEAGIGPEEIDLYIPHQANLRINQAFAKAMGLPDEKILNNIQRYGNTTAATIPLALDEAIEQGRVSPGSTMMFFGLGAGLTWGASVYRWSGETPVKL
jgi:3-oxoacyl-[acyl-carrier-protein] synthase-3